MNTVTHFLCSWLVANTVESTRRDRALVTLSGVVPDLDGLGVIAELATRGREGGLYWWSEYHHVLCHNLGFGLLLLVGTFLIATRRWITACLSFAAFHIHLLGDLVGARGPDGHQWPIPYLSPFSDALNLTWKGQWELNAWPNIAITVAALILTFYLAWRRGYSPLEFLSARADKAFVRTLQDRLGSPKQLLATERKEINR